MDVVYEGALVLGEGQVQQLLGYQAALNKHINWDKTRTQVRWQGTDTWLDMVSLGLAAHYGCSIGQGARARGVAVCCHFVALFGSCLQTSLNKQVHWDVCTDAKIGPCVSICRAWRL
jgi:hypothetical protein